MPNIEDYLIRLFGHEGGYVNNPRDPGGETRWGIAKRSHPHEDIKNLSKERAAEIYRTQYWTAINGDELPDVIAFDVLDGAVNSGPSTAIRWLQRAVGVADDGDFGPISLAAVRKANPWALVARYNGERLEFLSRLSTWPTFGKGWSRRIATNLKEINDA